MMCVDLRKIKPYFFKYQTYAKGRWLGRKLIEVFNTEFRDRDNTFYVSSGLFSFARRHSRTRSLEDLA